MLKLIKGLILLPLKIIVFIIEIFGRTCAIIIGLIMFGIGASCCMLGPLILIGAPLCLLSALLVIKAL